MTNGAAEQEMREKAVERVKQKRGFRSHLTSYVLVNLLLVFIWWMSGADTANMWFLWVIAGWGIGLVAHAFTTFAFADSGARFESEVDAEMRKMQQLDDVR